MSWLVIVFDLSFFKKWVNFGGFVEGRDGSRGGYVWDVFVGVDVVLKFGKE